VPWTGHFVAPELLVEPGQLASVRQGVAGSAVVAALTLWPACIDCVAAELG
jgi:hypothetical protein